MRILFHASTCLAFLLALDPWCSGADGPIPAPAPVPAPPTNQAPDSSGAAGRDPDGLNDVHVGRTGEGPTNAPGSGLPGSESRGQAVPGSGTSGSTVDVPNIPNNGIAHPNVPNPGQTATGTGSYAPGQAVPGATGPVGAGVGPGK
jgi:hypothetical protein